MQHSVNTEVDLLESLLQPMVAAGHSLRDEDEAEAKEGQSPEEVQNQDLERFLQQLDPDPGLVPDEAPDSDEDHDSLWSSMAEGLPPETLSSEEFQSLVDGFRNTVQDTVEEERMRTLSALEYHTWMKFDHTLSLLEKVYNLQDYLDGMESGLDLHHSRDQTPLCLAMEPLQEFRVTVCKVLEELCSHEQDPTDRQLQSVRASAAQDLLKGSRLLNDAFNWVNGLCNWMISAELDAAGDLEDMDDENCLATDQDGIDEDPGYVMSLTDKVLNSKPSDQ
ncbi:hypothetical protein [Faecalibaculum rodentium]|uniref:hypothetical protein n=1 Tax=Faecalibaculum rodentium TaxID=1702221 RepID=UPI0025A52370|nr:hypothetical protein [Faecalibaculum rodentium]